MPAASLDVGPDGRIGVVWTSDHEDQAYDVYFAESADRCVSFGTNVLVNEDMDGLQQCPTIAYDSFGLVHVLWEASGPLDYDYNIYLASSADSGRTFSAPALVNDDPPGASDSQAAVSAVGHPVSGVAAVWLDYREQYEQNVYYAGTAPVGVAWGDSSPLDPDNGEPVGGGPAGVYPNPTGGGAYLRGARARIYDLKGRLVRSIGPSEAGSDGWIYWNGRDRTGVCVASGVYWARCDCMAGERVRKIVVVR